MFVQCIHQMLLCTFLVKSSYAHLKSVFCYKKRNTHMHMYTHTHIHVHKHIIKSKSINTTIFWNVSSVIWRNTHTQCKDTETHNKFQSHKLNQTKTKIAEEFCGFRWSMSGVCACGVYTHIWMWGSRPLCSHVEDGGGHQVFWPYHIPSLSLHIGFCRTWLHWFSFFFSSWSA